MSWAIELLYGLPRDLSRERRAAELATSYGGRVDFIETTELAEVAHSVTITFEFDDLPAAENCATAFRANHEHIEGPYEYG
jgi:hypothetical protein